MTKELIVLKQESRPDFVISLEQPKMPTKCSEYFQDSMPSLSGQEFVAPFENIKHNLFRELKMILKHCMTSSKYVLYFLSMNCLLCLKFWWSLTQNRQNIS